MQPAENPAEGLAEGSGEALPELTDAESSDEEDDQPRVASRSSSRQPFEPPKPFGAPPNYTWKKAIKEPTVRLNIGYWLISQTYKPRTGAVSISITSRHDRWKVFRPEQPRSHDEALRLSKVRDTTRTHSRMSGCSCPDSCSAGF